MNTSERKLILFEAWDAYGDSVFRCQPADGVPEPSSARRLKEYLENLRGGSAQFRLIFELDGAVYGIERYSGDTMKLYLLGKHFWQFPFDLSGANHIASDMYGYELTTIGMVISDFLCKAIVWGQFDVPRVQTDITNQDTLF